METVNKDSCKELVKKPMSKSYLKHFKNYYQKHENRRMNECATKKACNLEFKFSRRKRKDLRERMESILKSAKFRYINEKLYTSNKEDISNVFNNLEEFNSYHVGYSQQVKQWPQNPLQIIINNLKNNSNKKLKVADFGCGEAKLAQSLANTGVKVFSFDLIAQNSMVTACDMAHTPLFPESIDVVVFCLSLMGFSISSYIQEANRVLKIGGQMKIAEVESRFDNVNSFTECVKKYGFDLITKDTSNNFFIFFDFKKVNSISKKRKSKLPELKLKPCIYKKR